MVPAHVFGTVQGWSAVPPDGQQYLAAYTQGETYKLAAPRLTRAALFTGQSGRAEDITYSMAFTDQGSGNATQLDFYVGSSGETLAQPSKPGRFTGRLVATDSAGAFRRCVRVELYGVP